MIFKTKKEWSSLGFFIKSFAHPIGNMYGYKDVHVKLCGPTRRTYEFWESVE
jgi:hypothetical protein